MTTPRDIINLALKASSILGVGQTALAEDINDSFVLLNQMISQWAQKRWLVYRLETFNFNCTGAQSYTVGPGSDFPITPRPDRLESAFVRQINQQPPNQVDYPLDILPARETYNRIALKKLTSFPSMIYYEPAYPVAQAYPWPVPTANIYSLFLTFKQVIPKFTSLSQDINLPPEYEGALLYNLAIRVAANYQVAPRADVVALAKDGLATIRGSNTALALMQMPEGLVRPGIYNPYSDQTY